MSRRRRRTPPRSVAFADQPVSGLNRAEQGQPGNIERSSYWDPTVGPAGWQSASDEPNIDLQFPWSIPVFDLMARTDGQIGAVLRSIVLSMRRAKWTLATGAESVEDTTPIAEAPMDPAAALVPDTQPAAATPKQFADPGVARVVKPEVENFVRTEIGLPRPGENLPDTRVSRVSFRQHLQDALDSLHLGFAIFEVLYQVEYIDGKAVYHLHKLASRPQKTIKHFLVNPDGDLRIVVQEPIPTLNQGNLTGIPLKVETLLVYCHERKGADWSGNSILRTCYKNWLVKDVTLRITAQIIERNGMGIPDVTYTQGGTTTTAQALELAKALRAGSTAGIAHASDVTVQILGTTGQLADPLPFLKYNDEQIAGAALQQWMTLGHDDGARSLGDTFLDVFKNSLRAEAETIAEVFTQQVIRPLVEANFPGEAYPVLTAGEMTDETLDLTSLATLVSAKIITADDSLEAWLRDRMGLPEMDAKGADRSTTPPPAQIMQAPPGQMPPAETPSNPVGKPDTAQTGGVPSAASEAWSAWLDARRVALAGV